jgi:hypothetical protein
MAYITFQPNDYFNTKLYTGTGSSNALTGVGFQPDWTWIKVRSEANNHELYDAVRGVTKRIYSDLNNAEDTNTAGLTAFGTDGFTVNTGGAVNGSSKTYVAWNWKANGAGSANTDGSINSTVSANTTSGFSIVTWTGNSGSVGHGLGVKPAMLITKSLGATGGWYTTHKSLGAEMQDNYIFLNTSDANSTNNDIWGGEPTTSTFSVGSGLIGNTTHVAYCFAEKKGFSKFGSYVGNGSTWGTFVNCGFKPAWIIAKRTSDVEDWFMYDTKRDPINVADTRLKANGNPGEATNLGVDFLSNGFKWRSNTAGYNASGSTYIYMAFAEEPVVASTGDPATAR